jgi:hypothetical protein
VTRNVARVQNGQVVVAVRLQRAHRGGNRQREAVLVGGVVLDHRGGADELGVECACDGGTRIQAQGIGVHDISDGIADTGVNEHVEVAVLDILQHLVRERDDGSDLLDVEGAAAELSAGNRLGAALTDERCRRGAVPDCERLTARTGCSGVACDLQGASRLENPVRQECALSWGEN